MNESINNRFLTSEEPPRLLKYFAIIVCCICFFLSSCRNEDNESLSIEERYKIALEYCANNETDNCLSSLKELANEGMVEAMYSLGHTYSELKNIDQEIYWYEKAANAGVYQASYNLGVSYLLGDYGTVNYEKAAYWVTKSAEDGSIGAATLLEIGRAHV